MLQHIQELESVIKELEEYVEELNQRVGVMEVILDEATKEIMTSVRAIHTHLDILDKEKGP